MNLYHVTSAEAAGAILETGFHDGDGNYLTTERRLGVWLTDDPIGLDLVAGAWLRMPARIFVRVELKTQESELAPYALILEGCDGPALVGRNYREWQIPADWLRGHILKVGTVENDGHLLAALQRERMPIPRRAMGARWTPLSRG
jgi:hypothetical protein